MERGEKEKENMMVSTGDVGSGLAWSYYYGYLKLILPGLEDRAETFEYAKERQEPFPKKFVAVMPYSCHCPATFAAKDENIETVGGIKFSVDVAGNVGRNFNTTVHRVTDPRDPKKVCTSVCVAWTISNYFSFFLFADLSVHGRILHSAKNHA